MRHVIHSHSGSGSPVTDLVLSYAHFVLANDVYPQPFFVTRVLINYTRTD